MAAACSGSSGPTSGPRLNRSSSSSSRRRRRRRRRRRSSFPTRSHGVVHQKLLRRRPRGDRGRHEAVEGRAELQLRRLRLRRLFGALLRRFGHRGRQVFVTREPDGGPEPEPVRFRPPRSRVSSRGAVPPPHSGRRRGCRSPRERRRPEHRPFTSISSISSAAASSAYAGRGHPSAGGYLFLPPRAERSGFRLLRRLVALERVRDRGDARQLRRVLHPLPRGHGVHRLHRRVRGQRARHADPAAQLRERHVLEAAGGQSHAILSADGGLGDPLGTPIADAGDRQLERLRPLRLGRGERRGPDAAHRARFPFVVAGGRAAAIGHRFLRRAVEQHVAVLQPLDALQVRPVPGVESQQGRDDPLGAIQRLLAPPKGLDARAARRGQGHLGPRLSRVCAFVVIVRPEATFERPPAERRRHEIDDDARGTRGRRGEPRQAIPADLSHAGGLGSVVRHGFGCAADRVVDRFIDRFIPSSAAAASVGGGVDDAHLAVDEIRVGASRDAVRR
mmetsp:Transcript_14765/g.60270  ORF Transcript_14765/g.60270 Transcript_14765/m.60270 type:complete len:504 (+) Transcript_14765:5103-6614(+)